MAPAFSCVPYDGANQRDARHDDAGFPAGNYRFIPAVFQYSSGAAADPGFEIERVRFDRLLPLAEGFARIADYIQAAGRPLTSFCACELRSPAAFTEDGFRAFNQHYVKTLAEWGLFDGTTNPVARSNVCPEIDPPAEPSFYAFSFTRPSNERDAVLRDRRRRRSARRQRQLSRADRALSRPQPGGIEGEGPAYRRRNGMPPRRLRLRLEGHDRRAGLYVHDFHPVLADELVRHGAVRSGLTWHFARPPVVDLEYEMDCRRVLREVVI